MIDLTEEPEKEPENIEEQPQKQDVKKSEKEELLDAIAELTHKVNELSEGDDLEREFEFEEKNNPSVMLHVDAKLTDSFGDPVELHTKTRINNYNEAFVIARTFTEREYHNMMGNRYGKHSKLIRAFDDDGKPNRIDMTWFSGNDVKIVNIIDSDGIERPYYKVRILVYDILIKKILMLRIATSDGAARQEEIQHRGASTIGKPWLDQNAPLNQMKPVKYNPANSHKTTMKNVGEVVFDNS